MKKKTEKKNKAEKPKTEQKPTPEPENETPFDFGGLPQRDIKKNLGCG
jgi:hypothetical protein